MDDIQVWVTLVKDIVTGLAALTAAYLAIRGFNTWKDQLKAKTEYELAQRVAKAAYEVRDAINLVRSPTLNETDFIEELQNDAFKKPPIPNGGPPDFDVKEIAMERLRKQAAIYDKIWQNVRTATTDLEFTSLEAEAIWGKDARDVVKPLLDCAETLRNGIRFFFEIRQSELFQKKSRSEINEEKIKNLKTICYLTGEEKDENSLTNEINRTIDKINDFLKPHLEL